MNEKIRSEEPVPEYVQQIAEALQSPETKAPEALPKTEAEIQTEREAIRGKIESETKALNEAQAALGLPPTDTSNAIQALRRKEAALTAAPITAEQEPNTLLLNENSEKLYRLGMIFQKRINNNFSELLGKPETSRIMHEARVLNGSQSFDDTGRGQVTQALNNIASALEKYGSFRNSGPVRDDAENVRSIAIFANEAAQSARALERHLQNPQFNAQEAARAASRLASELDKVRDASTKRASMLRDYLRR